MRLHTRDIQTKGVFGNNSQRQEAIAYVDESIRRFERLLERRTSANLQSSSLRDKADNLLMLAPFASSKMHDVPSMRSLLLASSIDDLRKAVDPFVLFKATIDLNTQLKVTPCLKLEDLPKDRTHRFLIEIRNEGHLQDQFKIRIADHSENESIRRCEIKLVENIFSSAKLTGDESEWKLVELRWHEAGSYQIEASFGSLPASPESRFVLSLPFQ